MSSKLISAIENNLKIFARRFSYPSPGSQHTGQRSHIITIEGAQQTGQTRPPPRPRLEIVNRQKPLSLSLSLSLSVSKISLSFIQSLFWLSGHNKSVQLAHSYRDKLPCFTLFLYFRDSILIPSMAGAYRSVAFGSWSYPKTSDKGERVKIIV